MYEGFEVDLNVKKCYPINNEPFQLRRKLKNAHVNLVIDSECLLYVINMF